MPSQPILTTHLVPDLPAGGARLHTASGAHCLDLLVADGFASRLRGLMLSRLPGPDSALLLTRCTSVHTGLMLMPIDVVYLDARGVVCRCVPEVKPWRASAARHRDAAHTLELPAGAIARCGIAVGDRLEHPAFAPAKPRRASRQGGIAVIEFVIVGPILTVIGLSLVQYGMLFFAKNQLNHGAFMAARAGSLDHAKLASVSDAYSKALIPMYGGGETAAELAKSWFDAKAAVATDARIELLNPTKESFADFNDPKLQAKYNTTKRVIPFGNQAHKAKDIKPNSGQTVQDANLLKLRITHGYEPKVPIVASIYKAYQKYFDTKKDVFHTQLINDGKIPVVSHVTVQMQSDAIEPTSPVSSPGPGNNGSPVNPPAPPKVDLGDPPDCPLSGCSTPTPPPQTPPPTGGVCKAPVKATLSADTTFAFGSATLSLGGKLALDTLITSAKALGVGFSKVQVTGYTDPLGTAALNDALSKARAETVSNYLSANGITADEVEVVGAGATNLKKTLADCPGSGAVQKDCLEPNRRVEIVLLPKST